MNIVKEHLGKYVKLNDRQWFGGSGIVKIVGISPDDQSRFVGELPEWGSGFALDCYAFKGYQIQPGTVPSNKFYTIYHDNIKEIIDFLPIGTKVRAKGSNQDFEIAQINQEHNSYLLKDVDNNFSVVSNDNITKITKQSTITVQPPESLMDKELSKNIPLGSTVKINRGGVHSDVKVIGYWPEYNLYLIEAPSDNTANSIAQQSHIDSWISQGYLLSKDFKAGTKYLAYYGHNLIGVVSKANTFTSMIKADLNDTAYRVAAAQLNRATKAAILATLKSQGTSKLKTISQMLDSEMGTALVSMMMGLALTYAPKISEHEKAKTLAQEFRIAGMATAGNEVIDTAMTVLLPVLMQAVSSLPQENSQLRVEAKEEPQEELLEEVVAAKAMANVA